MYLENRQELLNVNKTNKNDVIRTLGQPHQIIKREEYMDIYRKNKSKRWIYKLGKEV